ncbi:MAG: riboflavin biosynthesis protein RibF [Defluviitaleaceae bacterium]|nr:riboflavin biosynthesis protein RibF [Defluviitaleaceae bacterium]
MQIIHNSNAFDPSTGTAITIGKFEALHQGHSQLIKSTIEYAKNYEKNHVQSHALSSVVLSFAPHPTQVLSDPNYKPLFTPQEQAFTLSQYGLDYWIPYPFDKSTAQLTPKSFCQRLQAQFNCKALLVGEGFRFGRNREGTPEILHAIGQEIGIDIVTIPFYHADEKDQNEAKISTSQIRDHLSKGQIKKANQLLGRPFFIMGTVQKGRQLGRTIGFPTANMHPAEGKFLPPDGVYAAKIQIGDFEKLGITHIEINPTVADEKSHKIKTHIFDFTEDVYGQEIIVELHDFIRPHIPHKPQKMKSHTGPAYAYTSPQ